MAVVIPAVVGWVAAGGGAAIAAAAGAVAAGTAGLAAYATLATVAGGFLSTIGGLTKNQKLAKIGGYLSLAGGIGQVAGSLMSGAASSAAGSAVTDAATDVAAEQIGSGSLVGPAIDGMAGAAPVGEIGNSLGQPTLGGGAIGPPGEMLAAPASGGQALTMQELQAPSLMEQASAARAPTLDMGFGTGITQPGQMAQPAALSSFGKLEAIGAEISNPSHLQSLIDSSGGGLRRVGEFIKDNKELVQLGGRALEGGMAAYGRQSELDEQMAIMEARRRRLNQPIALRYSPLAPPITRPGG